MQSLHVSSDCLVQLILPGLTGSWKIPHTKEQLGSFPLWPEKGVDRESVPLQGQDLFRSANLQLERVPPPPYDSPKCSYACSLAATAAQQRPAAACCSSQEHQAGNALDALAKLSQPEVSVLRGGEQVSIPTVP